jgi:18S rRNA (adenine1779-N6/adenine1780-N6)-dimethyltransferase
MHANQRPEQV